MHKSTFILPILILLLSCDSDKKEQQSTAPNNNRLKLETAEPDPCEEKSFIKKCPNRITVHSTYFTCEPDWFSDLSIKKNDREIYTADSLLEYEFKELPFPTYISDSLYEYILIERNDRPALDKVDVFRIGEGLLDSLFTIPLPKTKGKDLDGDRIIEFWGTMDFAEAHADGSIGYNPILVFEIEKNLIRMDSSATKNLNKEVYGEFYGYDRIDSLSYSRKSLEKNWPEKIGYIIL